MNKILGQPQFLKEINVGIVEDIIIHDGPITKPEIAKKTGLSLPTVNKIVSGLEQENRVKPCGMEGGSVGRKAQLYVVNENYGNILALYYMENCVKCSVINMVGDIIYRFTQPMDCSSRENAYSDTFIAIERMKENAQSPIVAIGIGVPGIVNSDQTLSNVLGIPGWEGINLSQVIAERYGLKTYVESVVKLTTLGYYHSRLVGQADNMVYLYFDRGIGSGIVIDQSLYRGSSNFAGSFGYMFMENPADHSPQCALPQGHLEKRILHVLQSISEAEDSALLQQMRNELIDLTGRLIVNYICILNPEVIVLKGSVVSTQFMEEVIRFVKLNIPGHSVPEIIEDTNYASIAKGIACMCRTNIFHNLRMMTV